MEQERSPESTTDAVPRTPVVLYDRTRPVGPTRPDAPVAIRAIEAPRPQLALGPGPAAPAVDDGDEPDEPVYTVVALGPGDGWDLDVPDFLDAAAEPTGPTAPGVRRGVVAVLVALAVGLGAIGGGAGAWSNASRRADAQVEAERRARARDAAAAGEALGEARAALAASGADVERLRAEVGALRAEGATADAAAAGLEAQVAALGAQLEQAQRERVFFEALARNYERDLNQARAAEASPS